MAGQVNAGWLDESIMCLTYEKGNKSVCDRLIIIETQRAGYMLQNISTGARKKIKYLYREYSGAIPSRS